MVTRPLRNNPKYFGTMTAKAAIFVIVLLAPCVSCPAAELTMPHVFGDHMVLQAGQPARVWGWTGPGEAVTVRFAGQEQRSTAANDGRWEVRLEPIGCSAEPRELIVAASQTLRFKDVLVGEVWLCSGQSNMEKPLGEQRGQKPTLNYEQELRASSYPQIRLLRVPRGRSAVEIARDFNGAWVACGPASLEETKFSAAAYFFGRKIHLETKVPVGLIDASVGGSMIEPWTTPEGFASVPALAAWAKAAQSPPATVDIYQGVNVMHVEPCTMYRAMIAPLVPFALRGVLWYQGESNVYSGDNENYAAKMTALIQGWRGAWGQELPFYYVQIAPLYYHTTRAYKVVSPEAEPRLWEAQAACLRLPHTGMVVTTDLVDDLNDIHPRNKKDVGERLALWALANDYGRADVEPSGPIFRDMEIAGDRAVLHFGHVGGGLVCKGSRGLNWFVISGADGEWFPASAVIEGDTVAVTSPRVPKPRIVRFGWDEAAQPNLFNKAGLPAIPFRTDAPFAPFAERKPPSTTPKP